MLLKKIVGRFHSVGFRHKLKKHGKRVRICCYNSFEGLRHVTIGNDFSAGDGLWLAAYERYRGFKYAPEIEIGNNVHLSRNCHIGAINKIVIEDNVLIGSNVLINDHAHGESVLSDTPRVQMPLVSKGPIVIKRNAWIGDNVCIMPNVTIGENCIIGANSVVTHDIPANCVAVGAPARVVKELKRENN